MNKITLRSELPDAVHISLRMFAVEQVRLGFRFPVVSSSIHLAGKGNQSPYFKRALIRLGKGCLSGKKQEKEKKYGFKFIHNNSANLLTNEFVHSRTLNSGFIHHRSFVSFTIYFLWHQGSDF